MIQNAVPGTYEKALTAGEWPGHLQSGMAVVLLAFSFISDLMLCLPLQSTALPQQSPAQQECISSDSLAGDLCRPASWAGCWCAEAGESPSCVSWVPWAPWGILQSVFVCRVQVNPQKLKCFKYS